jgi:hypothetical protein
MSLRREPDRFSDTALFEIVPQSRDAAERRYCWKITRTRSASSAFAILDVIAQWDRAAHPHAVPARGRELAVLNESGYVEGRSVAIEISRAEGQYDRLPAGRHQE